jgi:glycerol kinase
MIEKKYVMAFDAGTSSSRAILFDSRGQLVSIGQREFTQLYPKPGWVEHDPEEIWATQIAVAQEAINSAGIHPSEIAAIGITNQRETTVVWDRLTGKPVHNAIVWQDRRTADIIDDLARRNLSEYVAANTGLVLDAYFSGSKVQWILDNVPGVRARAEKGEIAFGTVDSWLIWKLTGGKAHVTDYSNASRTMLFNINTLRWDERLLAELRIPRSVLPDVRNSSDVYGNCLPDLFGGVEIPIASAIGDQQGALFGQACFESGSVKATYGTGGTMLMNTGSEPVHSKGGLLTTIAWGIGGKVEYALEGTLFSVGSVVQWLRDEMQLIQTSGETEERALSVADTSGVYVVPAFSGLSAPFWDQRARGTIVGITRGCNKNHIIRASLESMAYQIRDITDRMREESGIELQELKVDGGASANNFVLQFQADLLGVDVLRPKIIDTTARGAAFLAGLAVGFWKDRRDLATNFELDRHFTPTMERVQANTLYSGWSRALGRAQNWELHS